MVHDMSGLRLQNIPDVWPGDIVILGKTRWVSLGTGHWEKL